MNRARAWQVFTDLAELYWEYIVELEAREKWLCRIKPLLVALGKARFLSYFAASEQSCVYIILSQLTGMYYVGETCNFRQRSFQHVYDSTGWRPGEQQVHRFMQRFGAHRFIILPLVGPLDDDSARSAIERKLIRMLQPPLNVEHTPHSMRMSHGIVASVAAAQHGKGSRLLMHQRDKGTSVAVPTYMRFALHVEPKVKFQSLDLALIAAYKRDLQRFSVLVSPGALNLNCRDVLRLQFGASIVSVLDTRNATVVASGTLRTCLKHLAPPVLHGMVLVIHSLQRLPAVHEGVETFLRYWQRDAGLIRALYYTDTTALLKLYQAAGKLPDKKKRGHFKQRIAYVFSQRFGFRLSYRPVLSLPYVGKSTSAYVNTARATLHRVIHSAFSFMPVEFREHYLGHARIVVRKGTNVEDLFHNYRQFAAAFDPKHKMQCVCDNHPEFLRCKEKKHICCRADSRKWPQSVPSIDVHGKYTPMQSSEFVVQQFVEQCVSICFAFGRIAQAGAVRKAMYQILPEVEQLKDHGHQDAKMSSAPPEAGTIGKSLEYFEAVQAQLSDLVCLPLDRNLHSCVFQCPRLFWDNIMELYVKDKHYKRVFFTEEELLLAYKLDWRAKAWNGIAPIYSKARASPAYYLPKNKDVLKLRPIVPNCHHPLKNVYSVASRALMFVLESLDFDHFNLPTTTAMKAWLLQSNEMLGSAQCVHTTVVGHDVKQMYTELVHDKVVDAVRWLIDRARTQSSVHVLSVRRRGRRGVAWGRKVDRSKYTAITLDQVLDVAMYELEHTFLKVGCIFLWQLIGLAMGGFLSPALAQGTSAVAEYYWLRSLGADRTLVAGMRYMDDSTLVLGCDPVTANRIIESYRSECYPEGLVLECTGDASQGPLEILECIVTVRSGLLHMQHRNRNAGALATLHKTKGALPFKKVIPYDSAVPLRTLSNSVVGLLHRLEINTSPGDWLQHCQVSARLPV